MGFLQHENKIIVFLLTMLLSFVWFSQTTLAQGGDDEDVGVTDVGNPGYDGFVGFDCHPPLTCPKAVPIHYNVDTGAIEDVRDSVNGTRVFFTSAMSQTMALSQSMSTMIVASNWVTASTVPVDYAAWLPRPVAQAGYQFETMGSDLQRRYSVVDWTRFFISILVIPIKFAKGLMVLGRFLGPLGLFMAWLFIMLPWVAWMKLLGFIKDTIIRIINFFIEIIRVIGDIWDMFPFA